MISKPILSRSEYLSLLSLGIVVVAGALLTARSSDAADAREAREAQIAREVVPHVSAESPEAAGRYLIRSAGCNDCHTPGWMQNGGQTPEDQWLTGVPVGWRGPWGTTYASNLRRFVRPFTEAQFIHLVRTRNSRPPMPWMSLHAMSDKDLGSIYRYIRSLPVVGDEMPDYVPPDQEPRTPFLNMAPQNLPTAAVEASAAR